jgi:hypothetical protein
MREGRELFKHQINAHMNNTQTIESKLKSAHDAVRDARLQLFTARKAAVNARFAENTAKNAHALAQRQLQDVLSDDRQGI